MGVYAGGIEDYAFTGVTSIDNPLHVDPGTLFQIGSTTKTFTATALMALVERGMISLDEPVRSYLPSLRLADSAVAERVTLAHLLTHTGGWVGDFREQTGDGDDALARFIDLLPQAPQISPLGAVASYSNSGFNLAGRVIEVVTGKTYEAAVTGLVLEPLGMGDTFFFAADVMTRRFVVGHRSTGGRTEVCRPWGLPRAANSSGGVISTAADQIRYARFHLGDGAASGGTRVLGGDGLRRMREPRVPLHGGALGDWVGLPWLMRDVGDVRIVGHGGTMNGQTSSFDMVPDRDFAFTVLTNADSGGLLHHELTRWALERYCGIVEPEREPMTLTSAELAEYEGAYDARMAMVTAVADDGHLVLTVAYTEEGLRVVRQVYGDDPPAPPPLRIEFLSPALFRVVDGPSKGLKGNVLRDDRGTVTGINVGGRLAQRVR